MQIKSLAFENNSLIPSLYTCEGKNINPPLQFLDIPDGTQSLALIVDDPDAATDPQGPGKTFDHWFIWNIPPTVNEIPEGTVPPEAIQGLNGAGSEGYIGACPPNGTHRYFFKLFALNKKLDVSPNISKQQLENEIKNNMIDKAELIGLYQKHNGPQR